MRKYWLEWICVGVIIVTAIWAMWSLSTPGLFTSHDSPAHMTRLLAYDEGLTDGQFPVLWAGRVLWGIGSPVLMLNYQLPYYLVELIHQVGLSLTDSYKLTLALTFAGSGLLMYWALRSRYKPWIALAGAMLYMIGPYRLVDVYVRGALGECLAFLFPPIILWAFWRRSLGAGIGGLAGLFLSHPIGSAIFSGYFLLYAVVQTRIERSWKQLKWFIICFGVAAMIAAFNILPTIALTRYTYFNPGSVHTLLHFPTLPQLIYSPWGYGDSKEGPNDGMTFQIGLIHWVIIALAFLLFARRSRSRDKWQLTYNLGMTMVAILMMLAISTPIYRLLNLPAIIDYPWRILMFVMFSTGLLGAEIVHNLGGKKGYYLAGAIVAGLLFTNRNDIRINRIWPWNERDFVGWSGDVYGEYATRYRVTREGSGFRTRAEIVEGTGVAKITEDKSSRLAVITRSNEPIRLRINVMYFPGWAVWIDGRKQQIGTDCLITARVAQNLDDSGLLVCLVAAGEHTVRAEYLATTVQKLGYLITLSGLGIYLWIIFRSFYLPITSAKRSSKT